MQDWDSFKFQFLWGLGAFFGGAKPKKAIPWCWDWLRVLFLGLGFRDLLNP